MARVEGFRARNDLHLGGCGMDEGSKENIHHNLRIGVQSGKKNSTITFENNGPKMISSTDLDVRESKSLYRKLGQGSMAWSVNVSVERLLEG